jgi:hypothetical protein
MARKTPVIETPWAGVQDVARLLCASEAAVRKRVQREGDFPEPVSRSPLTWATADLYAYLLENVAPARRPPIPVQFWPRPTAPARLAAVENTGHAVELVFQPDRGLGTITLRYRSLYGTPAERVQRRKPQQRRDARSEDIVCDVGWMESDDGFYVRVHHERQDELHYEVTTVELARALGREVPVVPLPLVHSGALHRWDPGAPEPVVADVLAQDYVDDLRRYRDSLPDGSAIKAAVEQQWRVAHCEAVEEAWRSVERANYLGSDVILAAIPSEPAVAEIPEAVSDWTDLMIEPVGASAGTERIAAAIGFGDAYREIAELNTGHLSAPQDAFVGRFAEIEDDDAGLAHLILRRYALSSAAAIDPRKVKFLRHGDLPLAAVQLGKRFVFALPDVFLAAGIDQLDLTDPSVPLYLADSAEWVPLPGAAGGYSAGYPGAGPSHLTASVKHLLTGGRAGDPDSPYVSDGGTSNVFGFAGRAGVWSRRELKALFA